VSTILLLPGEKKDDPALLIACLREKTQQLSMNYIKMK
jgi:hypothetical protein